MFPAWGSACLGMSACTPSRLGVSRWSHQLYFLPGKECVHCFPARGLVVPAWERIPALHPDLGTNTGWQGKSTCTPSRLGVSRWSHQLYFLPGKECVHCFPARVLVVPAWERVPALLPDWGTNTGWQGKSTCTPSRLGVSRWSHQLYFLSGKECVHCFPARGLVVPAWERIPALPPDWGTNTGWQGKSTCTPSRLGVSRWSHQLYFLPGKECVHCFPARELVVVSLGKNTCTPS